MSSTSATPPSHGPLSSAALPVGVAEQLQRLSDLEDHLASLAGRPRSDQPDGDQPDGDRGTGQEPPSAPPVNADAGPQARRWRRRAS